MKIEVFEYGAGGSELFTVAEFECEDAPHFYDVKVTNGTFVYSIHNLQLRVFTLESKLRELQQQHLEELNEILVDI